MYSIFIGERTDYNDYLWGGLIKKECKKSPFKIRLNFFFKNIPCPGDADTEYKEEKTTAPSLLVPTDLNLGTNQTIF